MSLVSCFLLWVWACSESSESKRPPWQPSAEESLEQAESLVEALRSEEAALAEPRSPPERVAQSKTAAVPGKTSSLVSSVPTENQNPSVETEEVNAPRSLVEAEPLTAKAQRALDWLESQLGRPIPTPNGDVARLIDSYEDEARAGWIYDASMAAIVFAAVGKSQVAHQLLRGLEMLQDSEGAWVFSYDPDRLRHLGRKKYPGSMAWVVMAINFYEWETGLRTFAPVANRGLAYLLRFRDDDETSETYGAFSMGPAGPRIYGLEGNLDCYSAFLFRSKLDRNQQYLEVARGVRDFVFKIQWSGTTMPLDQKYFKVGYRDNTLFLDTQSWTVLNFWANGDPRLMDALQTAEERLRVNTGVWEGVSEIVGFNESAISTVSEKVWAEGTEGMVSAYLVLGLKNSAQFYHAQTSRYQASSGGIPYATRNSDAWPTVPAVSSTTWFLLNELSSQRNPFDPKWNNTKSVSN